jgi:hypothetical protein
VLLTEGFEGADLACFGEPGPAALAPSVSPLASLASVLSALPVSAHGLTALQDPGAALHPEVQLWTQELAAAGWNSAAFWARPQVSLEPLGLTRAVQWNQAAPERGARQSSPPGAVVQRAHTWWANGAPANSFFLLHWVCPEFPAVPELSPAQQESVLDDLQRSAELSASLPPAANPSPDSAGRKAELALAFKALRQAISAAPGTPFEAAQDSFGRRAGSLERTLLERWQRRLWALDGLLALRAWQRLWPQEARPWLLLQGLRGPGSEPPAWLLNRQAEPDGPMPLASQDLGALMVPAWLARCLPDSARANAGSPLATWAERIAPGLEGQTRLFQATSWLAAAFAEEQPHASRRMADWSAARPAPKSPRCDGLSRWTCLEQGTEGLFGRDLRVGAELPADILVHWPAGWPPARLTISTRHPADRLWTPTAASAERLELRLEPGRVFPLWSQRRGQTLRLTLWPWEAAQSESEVAAWPADLVERFLASNSTAENTLPCCVWLPEPDSGLTDDPGNAALVELLELGGAARELRWSPAAVGVFGLWFEQQGWSRAVQPAGLPGLQPAAGVLQLRAPAGNGRLWIARLAGAGPLLSALHSGSAGRAAGRLEFAVHPPQGDLWALRVGAPEALPEQQARLETAAPILECRQVVVLLPGVPGNVWPWGALPWE